MNSVPCTDVSARRAWEPISDPARAVEVYDAGGERIGAIELARDATGAELFVAAQALCCESLRDALFGSTTLKDEPASLESLRVGAGASVTVICCPLAGAARHCINALSHDSRMTLVGKVLQALDVKAFHPESRTFDLLWTPATAPAVQSTRLCELVVGELRRAGGVQDPAPGVVCGFMKLLCLLLTSAEGLPASWHRHPLWKPFKHYWIRWLVDTARLFASPQRSTCLSWWNSSSCPVAVVRFDERGIDGSGFPVSCIWVTSPGNTSLVDANLAGTLRVNRLFLDGNHMREREFGFVLQSACGRREMMLDAFPVTSTSFVVTAVGIFYRIKAGVPVLLASPPADPAIDTMLGLVARMQGLELVAEELENMTCSQVEDHVRSDSARLLCLRCDLCRLKQPELAATLEIPFEMLTAQSWTASTGCLVGVVTCAEDELAALSDSLLDAIVFVSS